MSGPAALAGGVALVVGSLVIGAPALVVPGMLILAIAAVAGAWTVLAARGASIRRVVDRAAVQEGEAFRVRAIVGLGPVRPGRTAVRGLGASRTRRDLEDGSPAQVAVRAHRRGRMPLAACSLATGDAAGLWERRVGASGPDTVLVLPRVHEVAAPLGTAIARLVTPTRARAGSPDEPVFEGLGTYRPGTSASRIHWQALARGAGLVERRFRPSAEDSLPVLVLDSSEPESVDALDSAARAAASLTRALASRGGCELRTGGGLRRVRPDMRGWPEAHAALALAEPGDPRPAAPPGRPVVWVTARRGGPVPALPAGSVLVAPGRNPASSISVAGCSCAVIAPAGRVAA